MNNTSIQLHISLLTTLFTYIGVEYYSIPLGEAFIISLFFMTIGVQLNSNSYKQRLIKDIGKKIGQKAEMTLVNVSIIIHSIVRILIASLIILIFTHWITIVLYLAFLIFTESEVGQED